MRTTLSFLALVFSLLLPSAFAAQATATSWGTVNTTVDYLLSYDQTVYTNTAAFCADFHNQCQQYVNGIGGNIVLVDCVSSQPGPEVYCICKGNSANTPTTQNDYMPAIERMVEADLVAGPSTHTTINSGEGTTTTTTKAASTKSSSSDDKTTTTSTSSLIKTTTTTTTTSAPTSISTSSSAASTTTSSTKTGAAASQSRFSAGLVLMGLALVAVNV